MIVPNYIIDDLNQNKEMYNVVDFNNFISQIKCGRKIG